MEEHPPMLPGEVWQIQLQCLSPPSRVVYQKRADEYNTWCLLKGMIAISAETLMRYLIDRHDNEKWCGATLWTINSIVGGFIECHTKRKPHEDLPVIVKLLKGWVKGESSKQAPTFPREKIHQYLDEAETNAYNLPRKAFAILAFNGLLRKSELINLKASDLEVCSTANGYNEFVKVNCSRLKSQNANMFEFFITDKNMVAILKAYLKYFGSELDGRLFRNMNGSNGKL